MKYLVAKKDVLDWRPALELRDDLLRQLKERAALLSTEEAAAEYEELVELLTERLQEEHALADRFNRLLERADAAAEEDLVSLHAEFMGFAGEHFKRHDSAAALLQICADYRERLIGRVLALAENQMNSDGLGPAPVDYAWIEVGGAGRRELALRGEYKALLVYGRDGDDATRWFARFAPLVVDLLEATGIARPAGISPALSGWRRGIGGWRAEMTGGGKIDPVTLITCLDMRRLHGSEAVYAEFENLIHSVLQSRPDLIRQEKRRAARLPLAAGFLGWFRVERTGVHRGEVNLQQYAYLPLVATVRIMAAAAGIRVANTGARIVALLAKGKLSVDMAESLLQAWHVINRQRIPLQLGAVTTSAPGYVDPEYLTEEEEQTLKTALEVVSNLQKLVYATITAGA